MGYAGYLEDINERRGDIAKTSHDRVANRFRDIHDRLGEISKNLVRCMPPPTAVPYPSRYSHRDATLRIPEPGEWQSLRQQIESLLNDIKAGISEMSSRANVYLKLLNDPKSDLVTKFLKAEEENADLKHKNEDLKRHAILLQYRLKEAGAWKNSYASSLVGASKEPPPKTPKSTEPDYQYTTSDGSNPTAFELAMQKAKTSKVQRK